MTDRFDPARYDAFVFDLDGTVWLGAKDPIPGAAEFLQRCRDRGATVTFATNATVHTPEALSAQLQAVGIAEPGETVVTSGTVIVRTLRAQGVRTVGAVIAPQLADLLIEHGIDVLDPQELDADAFGPVSEDRALVIGASRGATIGAVERLGRLAMAGHRLYISSRDAGFPIVGGMEPGGGVMLAALQTMYPVEATVLGKPSGEYALAVAEAVAAAGGAGRRILMVGDSQRADMGIAHHLRCDGLLLTAHSVRPIEADLPVPTYVAPTLAHDPVAYEPD